MSEPRRVLIVEDDPLQYRIARQHLVKARAASFEVEWAPTFDDGRRMLLEGRFDVGLLDYQLGDHDGLELLRQVRAADCTTPIIFLTADASPETDLAAMEAGAADYLVKGEITPRMVERSVRYALKLGETLAELRRLATRDVLTGLFNRREFERMLEQEMDRAKRFGHEFALVLLDLDHFKQINDRHGHPAGDAVLREVARRLGAEVRTVDRLARIGGEEIAAILVESGDMPATAVAGRMVAGIAGAPVRVDAAQEVAVTVSAGVALFPRHGETVAALVAAADRALYASKHAGRNRVTLAGGEAAGSSPFPGTP